MAHGRIEITRPSDVHAVYCVMLFIECRRRSGDDRRLYKAFIYGTHRPHNDAVITHIRTLASVALRQMFKKSTLRVEDEFASDCFAKHTNRCL